MTTRDRSDIDAGSETTDDTLSNSINEQEPTILDAHQDVTDGISLLTDEIVLKNTHPSWANWSITLALAGFFGFAALNNLASMNLSGFFGGTLVTGLIIAIVYYSRKQSRYIVTNQRVLKNVGLLRNSSEEARILDIRSLATEQGLLERLFGKGSVQIDSTGADGRIKLKGVKDYEQVANVIRERQRELEN